MLSRFLVVLLALSAPSVSAADQNAATIAGLVRDCRSGALPGVTVTVVTADDAKTVTAADGRYTLSAMPVGSHTVRAVLAGFGSREERVDLRRVRARPLISCCVRCLLRFLSFVGPPKLSELFALATVVAHVRVTASEPSEGACRGEARVAATVLESLKSPTPSIIGGSIAFWQEQWFEEPTPYPAGAELIVFLHDQHRRLWRSGRLPPSSWRTAR